MVQNRSSMPVNHLFHAALHSSSGHDDGPQWDVVAGLNFAQAFADFVEVLLQVLLSLKNHPPNTLHVFLAYSMLSEISDLPPTDIVQVWWQHVECGS